MFDWCCPSNELKLEFHFSSHVRNCCTTTFTLDHWYVDVTFNCTFVGRIAQLGGKQIPLLLFYFCANCHLWLDMIGQLSVPLSLSDKRGDKFWCLRIKLLLLLLLLLFCISNISSCWRNVIGVNGHIEMFMWLDMYSKFKWFIWIGELVSIFPYIPTYVEFVWVFEAFTQSSIKMVMIYLWLDRIGCVFEGNCNSYVSVRGLSPNGQMRANGVKRPNLGEGGHWRRRLPLQPFSFSFSFFFFF
jgi:hypothetical protein